jgi:hypothetical protein
MLVVPPAPFQKRRERPRLSPLLLVRATYDPGAAVTLVFNQPVNVELLDPTNVTVEDGPLTGATYAGVDGPPTRIDATTIQVELENQGPSASTQTLLNVPAPTGVKAVESSARWPGATNLPLPLT